MRSGIHVVFMSAVLVLHSFTVAAYNSINTHKNSPSRNIGPNVPPRITGQVSLVINQGESFSINLGYVKVTDPDSSFPSDFALQVLPGDSYTVYNNVIQPAANFWGPLTVFVTVTDGQSTSSPYGLRISVLKGQNKEPIITGQSPLSMKRGTSLAIELNNLQVSDPNNIYPTDFTLKVYGGSNYTVNGTTITPSFNFTGALKVPVTVNDGEIDSKRFEVRIDVLENVAPQITGQSALTVMQGSAITISLANLQVTDPDNSYPADFTLRLFPGTNYTINGNTITPGAGFSGNMLVPVTVNDGMSESNRFELTVSVTIPNVAPIITGQLPLNISQGGALKVDLSKLLVTDPDNVYPTGFSLTLYAGVNYTFTGNTVTPTPAFAGTLAVPVTVNDGKAESNHFSLLIDVIHQNIAPVITSQSTLSLMQGSAITISLANLQVTDPDNIYPADFTLKLFTGTNYTISGNTITPGAGFSGNLLVPVTVNDGKSESNRFNLKIGVTIPNVAPIISGQLPLNVNPAGTLTVDFSKILVTDPDNAYPNGFTLTLYTGGNYTINGNTVTPTPTFTGSLSVPVTVNDGQSISNRFNLSIAVSIPPQITGQERLTTKEDEAITLLISALKIIDADNPTGSVFKMKLGGGPNYTVSELTVTPAKNFFGILTIPTIVNDGKNDSEPFDLQITVTAVNDAPAIMGQSPLTTNENKLIEIDLAHLKVTDPDNTYPQDFTLKVSAGSNYSAAGNFINPAPGYIGTLEVGVRVNDGFSSSTEFKLKIDVVPFIANVAPIITGQKPISITQNAALTLQLSQLVVADPDDAYPQGFTLKVLPGNNYTVNATTIKPPPNFMNGTLSVTVSVNDGQADSQPFQVVIHVFPPTAKPRINGQRELITLEDSAITITLADLFVTDADDPEYPTGFSLKVLPGAGGQYTVNGNAVVPLLNLTGFMEVGVTVNDGKNTSDVFQLAILVTPVDDPPELRDVDGLFAQYDPRNGPVTLSEFLDVRDVDNEYLIMAEVGFRALNHCPLNDELVSKTENQKLRTVLDSDGILYIIGYASVTEYRDALRAIQYNYRLTNDINGNPQDIITGQRTVYYTVYDGQMTSKAYEKKVTMDIKIALDIPSAFTPNGDHANDTWQVRATNSDQTDRAVVKVYDKRGALLYESTGFDKAWDGIINGQVLPVDTYYYTIDMNLAYVRQSFKGAVTLLH